LPALAPSLATHAQTAPATNGTVELDPIEVQAHAGRPRDTPEGTTGYVVTRETTGTKTNTPVTEIPQSTTTVTRQELDDRDVQTLGQALNYTPGVTTSAFGYDPRFDAFSIRGFDVTYTGLYRDGLRLGGGTFSIPKTEPYGLQSITVLRGPASGLYGLGSPGGIVDSITKRPTASPFGELQMQVGSYSRRQVNFDLGGPVPDNDTFSYRITGLLRNSDTFQPGQKDDRTYIAPALTWRPDGDTSLTIMAEHLTSLNTGNASYYNDATAPSARQRLTRIFSNDPAFGNLSYEQYRFGLAFEKRVNDWLTLRQNSRYYHVDSDLKYTEVDTVDPATATAGRSTGQLIDNFGIVTVDNQAELRAALGPIASTSLFGLDVSHQSFTEARGFGAAPDLNLATLNYGAQAIYSPTLNRLTRQSLDDLGLYAQEQARWGGFLLTLNGREDIVRQDSADTSSGVQRPRDSAFTGRAALTYLFGNGLAPYVSYATQFAPQLGIDAAGRPFAPTDGDQKEVGVKYEIPGVRTLLTAALFDITQNNVLRTDPDNLSFQSATGQVESQGVELEATGNPLDGLNVTAAYTHLDVTINRGNADTTGRQFSGIPRDSVAAFAKYTIQPGSMLAGVGVGGGIRFIGSSYGDDQNTFKNRAATLFDAVLDYDAGQLDKTLAGLHAQINATNLFDRRVVACQSGYCYLDKPREVIGSLIYRF
jgi:iron complex outermembrane receptor protein